ncbi:multidrug DMT transporter permease [Paramesorhizobium deserti]|uniref:Multidrug DMT transporter permease n=1 Tax=Paramesorhizobium deserti TaxID=1494590 RepID=A0A135HZ06_9HYPH|nr:iron uptake system protein EfeO [Paramesorhizobium deserti]KXF78450.1 multidrug DMT transporter permease [Paramesorhizobium deserti]
MSRDKIIDPMPRLVIRIALALAVLLLIGAGVAFYYASQRASEARRTAGGNATVVTITGKTCDPNELTVPAGRATFEIVNKSDRAVEWEILDGVMVVEERENIAPGFSQTLNARLEPGEYAITCGLLSNPRGKLIVTPSAIASADASRPQLTAFIGALAEYKLYLAAGTNDLVQATGDLAAAVKSGNLDEAKRLYEPARAAYARIAPVSEVFSDLDTAIDARADYFEKREADPAFGGLHRIEYGLFAQNSTEGLAPVADKLVTDVATLQGRIHDMRIPPEKMIGGGATLINRFATAAPGQDEDRYAHTDLDSFFAELVGVRKIVDLVRPVAVKVNGDLMTAIDKDFVAIGETMDAHREGDGFVSYDKLGDADKAALKKQAATLAADLDKLRDSLGLS